MSAALTKIKSTLTELCFQAINDDKLGKFFPTLKSAQVDLSRDDTETPCPP